MLSPGLTRGLGTLSLRICRARGLALYSAMRALQIRKLRVPKPRVKPGDSF